MENNDHYRKSESDRHFAPVESSTQEKHFEHPAELITTLLALSGVVIELLSERRWYVLSGLLSGLIIQQAFRQWKESKLVRTPWEVIDEEDIFDELHMHSGDYHPARSV